MRVYILKAKSSSSEHIEGVFASYSAMMTYLYDKYKYCIDYNKEIVHWSKTEDYGCFKKSLFIEGIPHQLRYEAFDVIGEHSVTTDKIEFK